MPRIRQTLRFFMDAVRGDLEPDVETGTGAAPSGRMKLDGRLVAAVFDAVVAEKFSSTTDIREIGYFLLDYGLRYPKESAKVPIREGQALVRIHLGEPEMLAYISKSVAPEAILWISVWLLRDLSISNGDLTTFLNGIARQGGKVHPAETAKEPRDAGKFPEENRRDSREEGRNSAKNEKIAYRTPATAVGKMLSGLILRDQEEFIRWRAAVNRDDEQKERFRFTLFQVFRELVARRFSTEPDLRAVARFLRVPRLPISVDKQFPFLKAEALVRAALGERGLIQGVSIMEAADIRLQLVVYLAEDLGLNQNEVNDLVAGAERSTAGQ
jgi:hypothetical protein